LTALKNVVQDFAAREQKLNNGFRDQSAKETNTFESQKQQYAAEAEARLTAEMDRFIAAREQLESFAARRKARITRAYETGRKHLSDAINAADDECKRRAQQGVAEAEQERDAKLAQAAAAYEDFRRFAALFRATENFAAG
jgi:hypothetical protein